jgi:DGQHR domain-containing protein
MYAVMLQGRRNSKIEHTYPAIKARIGNRTVYNFLVNAKELANHVYVHHRKLSSLTEASQAYQRMLRPLKLKQIREFLDTDNGFFANNIILNFNKPLEWTRIKASDSVEIGTIKLPGYYGCAWIIDGQHRLYGAASANKDVLLPVIALEQYSEAKQAELFVADQLEKSPPPNDELVREGAARFEKVFREFVLEKLTEWHGNSWWKHGIGPTLSTSCSMYSMSLSDHKCRLCCGFF